MSCIKIVIRVCVLSIVLYDASLSCLAATIMTLVGLLRIKEGGGYYCYYDVTVLCKLCTLLVIWVWDRATQKDINM